MLQEILEDLELDDTGAEDKLTETQASSEREQKKDDTVSRISEVCRNCIFETLIKWFMPHGTGIPSNSVHNLYLELTKYYKEFQNNALWDAL